MTSSPDIAMVRHLMAGKCDFDLELIDIVRQPMIFQMHMEIVMVLLDLQLCCMTDAEFADSIVLMVCWKIREEKMEKFIYC